MDPNDVIEDFAEVIASLQATYDALLGAARTDALKKQVSVDVFLRAAVSFESFRSEWHIAAINQDASRFRECVQTSIRGTVSGAREYRGAAPRIVLDIPRYPSVAVIREIVDPLGRNVAFGDVAGWKARARRELVDKYANRVLALTDRRASLINSTVAIRNCIAHRSASSLREMNDALVRLPAGMRRARNKVSIPGIGAYLYASPPGSPSARTAFFYGTLGAIAQSLST
jgi:hypothetical protein